MRERESGRERERDRETNDRHTLGCVREIESESERASECVCVREKRQAYIGERGAAGREREERERVKGQAYFGERWVLLGLLLIFSGLLFVHDVLNPLAQTRCYLRRSVSATGVCVR